MRKRGQPEVGVVWDSAGVPSAQGRRAAPGTASSRETCVWLSLGLGQLVLPLFFSVLGRRLGQLLQGVAQGAGTLHGRVTQVGHPALCPLSPPWGSAERGQSARLPGKAVQGLEFPARLAADDGGSEGERSEVLQRGGAPRGPSRASLRRGRCRMGGAVANTSGPLHRAWGAGAATGRTRKREEGWR